MSIKKKLIMICVLAVTLALCCFGLFACNNNTEEQEKPQDTEVNSELAYAVSEDGSTIMGLTEYGLTLKTLNIPKAINGKTITSIDEKAFVNNKIIESINIPNTINSIGSGAFSGCSSLTEVTFGEQSNGQTSAVTYANLTEEETNIIELGAEIFLDCFLLSKIIIPNGITKIPAKAFSGCTELTSITIPSSVTSIGEYAFSDCYKLIEVINKSSLNIEKPKSANDYEAMQANGCIAYNAFSIKTEGESDIVNIDGYLFYTYEEVNYLLGCTRFGSSLTLPNDYNGQSYEIFKYAFRNRYSLKTIHISNKTTAIGERAFDLCISLANVYYEGTIEEWSQIDFYCVSWYNDYSNPLCFGGNLYINNELTTEANLTTVTKINDNAFNSCQSLESVTIGESVTSIGKYAFYNCSLTNINILNGVTTIERGAFEGCALINVVIPESVINISQEVFRSCNNLTSVTIPDSVESIGYDAFLACYKLVEVINKSDIDIAKTDTYSYYNGCVGNYALNIKTEGESEIVNQNGFLFYTYEGTNYLLGYTGKETKLELPDYYNGQNYEIYKYAFDYCYNLTSITIGSGVTAIGESAFDSCFKLIEVINKSSIEITRDNFSNGTEPFGGNPLHCLLNVKKSGESEVVNKDGFLFYTTDNKNYLLGYVGNDTDLILPNDYNGQSYEIYDFAFFGCRSLTSVTIGNGVTSIGDFAFYNCSSLRKVNILNSVKSIGNGAFMYCASLINITLPEELTDIGCFAYAVCASLFYVKIPNSITSIGDYAFNYCVLSNVCIPENLKSFGNGVFYGCLIRNVWYEGDLNSWLKFETASPLMQESNLFLKGKLLTYADLTNVEKINDCMFAGCKSLKSVTIGSGVTSIGRYAFAGCENLNKVNYTGTVDQWVQIDFKDSGSNPLCNGAKLYINNELVTEVNLTTATKISDYAFYNCKSLTSATIGSGVTSIGTSAFYGCSSMTSVTIGEGVTSIGYSAFSGCTSLTEIKYNATECADFWDDEYSGLFNNAFAHAGKDGEGIKVTIGKNVKKIPAALFCSDFYNDCTPKITEVMFEDGSVCESIGNYAFSYLLITSITIPDSVTSIGFRAFRGYIGYETGSTLASVTFENPNGWFVSKDSNASSGIDLTLTDSSTNATYLANYRDYHWKRG